MMPGMDGVTLLKELRSRGITTPALFLTARTEIDQRIEGLDTGVDDYLPKPFSTGELLARVRAMLRRKDHFTPDLLTFGALLLSCSTYELGYGAQTLSLSGKGFQVMEMLMRNPNMNDFDMSNIPQGGMQFPSGSQNSGAQSGNLGSANTGFTMTGNGVLFVISIIVLTAGLVFALFFKRR